jgi:hypothetical protein
MRALLGLLAVSAACSGTTGGALVAFDAQAGGAADVAPAQPFTSGAGFTIELERARLHVGAVYLNENVPLSGAGESSCVLPGIYVAQAFGPLDLDLLSPTVQPFPSRGAGSETLARTAEVWLLEGDIGRPDDQTVVLDVAGVAAKDGQRYPFRGVVTIGRNRERPSPSLATPGANPICRQRIVTPIAVRMTPIDGGVLTLRVDARRMFDGVDFTLATADAEGVYVIPDEKGGVSEQLFDGLRRNAGVYLFSFDPS